MKHNISSGIYYYKNKINGKLYIGQTSNFYKRQLCFKYDGYAGPVFNNALKKYGRENFEYGILTHCEIEKLNELEMFYIKRLKSKIPNGYNITDGGEGQHGVQWSEEKKELYRIKNTGKRNPNFGKKWNDEQRKRASEYMKKRIEKEGPIYIHTQEIAKKAYGTFVKNKYGKTIEEIDEIIRKHVYNNEHISYAEITKKYGFAEKTVIQAFKRLGIKNNKSDEIKKSRKHNPYIVQCDRNNHDVVLNIFPSLKDARDETGITSIHKVTHGFQENAGGYFWRYNTNKELPSKTYNKTYLKPLDNRRLLTEYQKKKLKENGVWKHRELMKKVFCFNSNGKLVDICESTKEAGKKYKVCYHTIVDICNNRRKNKYINGITFSYDKNHQVEPLYKTIILQYTIDGILINTYNSIKDACENTGAKQSSISNCISGKSKTSMGYIWKKQINE